MTPIAASGSAAVQSLNTTRQGAGPSGFPEILKRADGAQAGIDSAIRKALESPDMKSGELLALQAQIYRSSLELDLAGKMVEKVSGGLKQTLNTNV
jgi:hypothetical protein